MSSFKSVLENFDKVLQQYNPVNYHKLLPPLPDNEIENLLSGINVTDEDIFTLYKWKNGVVSEDAGSQLFNFEMAMPSLQEIIQAKKTNYFEFTKMNELVWLFGMTEDFFLFNCKPGKDYGKIHLFSVPLLSIENPFPYFDSLSTMFETTAEQYKKGGLVYNDKENSLTLNMEVALLIYNSLNPQSDFYNQES